VGRLNIITEEQQVLQVDIGNKIEKSSKTALFIPSI
jgi:hypothetical protein